MNGPGWTWDRHGAQLAVADEPPSSLKDFCGFCKEQVSFTQLRKEKPQTHEIVIRFVRKEKEKEN